MPGEDQRIRYDHIPQVDTVPPGSIQALDVFTDDDIIDLDGGRVPETGSDTAEQFDVADIRVQIEGESQFQAEVLSRFRAVGMEDAGQSRGAVQNGVRLPAAFEGLVRKGLAGFQVMGGPARVFNEFQGAALA